MNKVPKRKIVSVNFICVLFSVLDFFTLEDGTLFCPEGITTQYYGISQKSDNLVMQSIVGLHMVRFRANQFDAV